MQSHKHVPSHRQPFLPQMVIIAAISHASRHFSEALEGSLLVVRVLVVNLQCSRLLCVLGRSRHAVMAAIMPRSITNAKKWNLWSLWKASKNVSTYCLPTLCWMPTLAVCLVLNVPDRPSYKERKCFWAPERERHSLSDVNGKAQGNSGRVRRGLQERYE